MSRNWGVQVRPSSPAIRLAVERHRLSHQGRRRAELGERGPVARDLERRGEPRVPRLRNVGGADQARVVGEQAREPGLGEHHLPGCGQVQRQASVQARVDAEQRDVADRVDLVDHHHPSLAHRLHERGVDEPDRAAVVGGGDELVAEQIFVAGGTAADLHEPVERDAAAMLDLPSAFSPQAVGDRAGDLALAGSGRTDQPQERRLAGSVCVDQRAGEFVDRLAVQPRRVDPLAVREDDRIGQRLELEQCRGRLGGEVALGGDLVDGGQGLIDRAHARPPFAGGMRRATGLPVGRDRSVRRRIRWRRP